jgi:hypothetical protein
MTLPMKPHHMNRFLIFDVLEGRWMHIGYDTRSSAHRAANRMRRVAGDRSRYRVIDQEAPGQFPGEPEAVEYRREEM